jgi:hypothetical protein
MRFFGSVRSVMLETLTRSAGMRQYSPYRHQLCPTATPPLF